MPSPNLCLRLSPLFATALAALVSPAIVVAHETTLYRFAGGNDGSHPYAGVIADAGGNLFGTTLEGGGGCRKCGTVFKLAPDGTETVIYAFKGGHDGKMPAAGLVEDGNGNLYGTTSFPDGTVFEVTQQGVHTVLHEFHGKSDGLTPLGSLIFDSTGNLYGTASEGGSSSTACDGACGTVFEITAAGTFKVRYSFQGGMDGESPRSSLIFDGAGNLYGTTLSGGRTKCFGGRFGGCGTVFKLAPDGTETVLYAFRGGRDGAGPTGGSLIFDASGNLYGTTPAGGGTGCGGNYGCGTVFKLAPDGTETVLSRFTRAGGPTSPNGGVVMDTNGDLFGTSFSGGSAGCGTVFKLAPGHEAKAVYSFTCGKDGGYPEAGLLLGNSGELYGTTAGSRPGFGTVFAFEE